MMRTLMFGESPKPACQCERARGGDNAEQDKIARRRPKIDQRRSSSNRKDQPDGHTHGKAMVML